MGQFQRGDNNSVRNKGGFQPGRGSGFNKRDSRPLVLYDAICSNCGNKCQVPFRPTGEKPVYCRDCFSRMGGAAGKVSGDRFPKNDRRDFASSNQTRVKEQGSLGNEEIRKQLEGVNSKLERLIVIIQALLGSQGEPKIVPAARTLPVKSEVKAAVKKAMKKKK